MSSSNQGRKFSLLHVVLATGILVFLLLVLAPVYTGDRPNPRTHVLSNLKQLMTAGMIYCSDYAELVPPYGHLEAEKPASGAWIKGDQMAWREALLPYTKNSERFYAPGWPFQKKEGFRIQLARGVTNGASCFGYVSEITPKWFGSNDGWLRLNPADPPDGFLKDLGVDYANAPLLEDLAWTEKGWFGQVHTHRILDKSKPYEKVVGYMDGHARAVVPGK